MSTPYIARYTPCGHSIKQLRSDADCLKKAEGIKHQEALNRIAKALKYSDWAELIGQKSDRKRDDFFQGMYNDRKDSEMTQSLYADFLHQKNLPDTKDTYRLFVLQNWESFQALGMTNLDLDYEPMDSDVMLEELNALVNRRGASGLLPQNMGARLLETTIWAGHIFRGDLDVPDEVRQGYLSAALFCILGIRAYQLKSQKIAFKEDELFEFIQQYYMLAQLELTSRRTGLGFVLPDIDHVFKPDALLSFRIPENLREMIKPS